MLPMKCPKCSGSEIRIPITNNHLADQTVRKRQCVACGHVWFTVEMTVPTYAVGWCLEHKRKPVLRAPVQLQATHIEAQDQFASLREARRRREERADARHRRVKDCDSPDA